jgi:hypothetical protein
MHGGSVRSQMSVAKTELCETNVIEPPVLRGHARRACRDWRARRIQNGDHVSYRWFESFRRGRQASTSNGMGGRRFNG